MGAVLVVEVRDSGRFGALGPTEGRGAWVVAAAGLGGARVVVAGFFATLGSSPCFAAEAAVGAVKREGKPTGRVGDLGAGFLKPVGETLDSYQSYGLCKLQLHVPFTESRRGGLGSDRLLGLCR